MRKLKILFYDIETAPGLAYIWRAKTEYVNMDMTIHETFMLGWSAKWAEEDKMFSAVLTGDEARAQDDNRVVLELADLIREADIIVAHNIDQFDLPMLNNRVMLLGQEPLPPIKTIDTKKLAWRSFRLLHNKLDYLAQELGLGEKIHTEFSWWAACYRGDEDALAMMQEYNVHDVRLLEGIFWRIYPYVRGLPRLVEATVQGELICQYCGSGDVQRRGKVTNAATTNQRYQCNTCRRYSKIAVADTIKAGLRPIP